MAPWLQTDNAGRMRSLRVEVIRRPVVQEGGQMLIGPARSGAALETDAFGSKAAPDKSGYCFDSEVSARQSVQFSPVCFFRASVSRYV